MPTWTADIPVTTGWYLVRWGPSDKGDRIYIRGAWFDYEHTHEWIGPTWAESPTDAPSYLDPDYLRKCGAMFASLATCNTCRHWWKNDNLPGGTCDLAYQNFDRATVPIFADGSAFVASDAGTRSYLHTGPDFGCCHHAAGKQLP